MLGIVLATTAFWSSWAMVFSLHADSHQVRHAFASAWICLTAWTCATVLLLVTDRQAVAVEAIHFASFSLMFLWGATVAVAELRHGCRRGHASLHECHQLGHPTASSECRENRENDEPQESPATCGPAAQPEHESP